MKSESSIRTIAFVGNYLPRKCGIATFTSDLLQAVAARHPRSRCFAVPVNDIDGCYQYPDAVRFEIEEHDLDSYRRAADFLNSSNVDIVSVQHEFGIFGGPAGSHLLALLRELKAPAVTTLHTVLLKPNADQHRVMRKLIAHSTRLVVMTERGRTILQEVYHAPPAKIDLVPHGIPDVAFVAPDCYKEQFGVAGKKVLLTFGLLSPNKGIEHVLHALPDIVAQYPDLVYIVLGATHPHELRTRGEAYRLGLQAIAREHKLGEPRHLSQPLCGAEGIDRVHWSGGSLHYALSGRGPEYIGNVSVCVWSGQTRDLHALSACRRIAPGPARRTGAVRRPGRDCT